MKRKIINDPVHGFISFDDEIILEIIAHPYFQRLRNIRQMAFANLVYPGANHSRLHHSIGAYHLMCNVLDELRSKGIEISQEEMLGAKIAILLHDIGHGPFSHALEEEIVTNITHEEISLLIFEKFNKIFNGQLDIAIKIFNNKYHKPFLHQLISGQFDVDRMDYLVRDSFFTGVAEGSIGYDRIIKMLSVYDNEIVIEEKGIYSMEKFLISRRLMYWQVYFHKTVLGAEMLVKKIMQQAKSLYTKGVDLKIASIPLAYFIQHKAVDMHQDDVLDLYCQMDDVDVMFAVKQWMLHPEKVLAHLCRSLIERNLYNVQLSTQPFTQSQINFITEEVKRTYNCTNDDLKYYCFTGVSSNTTYSPKDDSIKVLFKNGDIKDISEVDNALILPQLSATIKKHYICFFKKH